MPYRTRITDAELMCKLSASGAVLVRGPKACGKTESAKRVAGSVLNVDRDPNVPLLMETAPRRLLAGKSPRLIDEWQEQPKPWYFVRHEVDERGKRGQFVLTGSANPVDSTRLHSGANLKKLASVLDAAKTRPAKSLNIITGTGISHRRSDGINVLSVSSLGI